MRGSKLEGELDLSGVDVGEVDNRHSPPPKWTAHTTPGPQPSMIAATVTDDGSTYITLVELTQAARAALLDDIRAIVREELRNYIPEVPVIR